MTTKKTTEDTATTLLAAIIIVALGSLVFNIAWNTALVPLFGLQEVTYLQMFWMTFAGAILVGGIKTL